MAADENGVNDCAVASAVAESADSYRLDTMPSPFARRSRREPDASPMALPTPPTGTHSILKQPMRSAASYLAALSDADARARRLTSPTPTSSERALSVRSSVSDDSSETMGSEGYDDLDAAEAEFGQCSNEAYRLTSAHTPGATVEPHVEEDPPYYVMLTVYLSYLILIVFGHLRDFFGKRFVPDAYAHLMPHNGYAALNSDFDSFYTRRLKARLDDCFARPITGVPGRTIVLLDRESSDNNTSLHLTGTRSRALNFSSYNYLGFAQARGDAVEAGLRRYGVSACGARLEGGTLDLHMQSEALVAHFLGTEDAMISSMGFSTNTTTIPALVGKGCLVISDELNHASIRFGVRFSGAHVRTFKHNDMGSLETLLREVVSQGQPRTHRPWKKILLIVEGLYSMEGTLVDLPSIMRLKRKYKFYLYVDEAHSIGALGPHGRGVTDYFGIDPRSVDILMGTFTKSFGASGGYIAGSRAVISRLRTRAHAGCYTEAMSPPVLTQIISALGSIMPAASPSSPASSPDAPALPLWLPKPDPGLGLMRLRRLAFNARYVSLGLERLGFSIYGHPSSPIIPLLLFHPGKMALFSRLMLARHVAVVVVGYPATPLMSTRARLCVSAAHTKEDCDDLLRACDEVGELLDLKHGRKEGRWTMEEVVRRAVELVHMEA